MAGRSRQSVLKRQRELRKAEKAMLKRQKREERRRRDAAGAQPEGTGPGGSETADSSGDSQSIPDSAAGTAEVRGDDFRQAESDGRRTP